MSRAVGIKRDLRLSLLDTYANYYYLNFRGYTGQKGDSYDRFLLRMNEMSESLNIINQTIQKLTRYTKKTKSKKSTVAVNAHEVAGYLNSRLELSKNIKSEYTSMEQLIKHFKY